MPPGDEELGKTELTLSAQSHPFFYSLSNESIKVKPLQPPGFNRLRVVYTKKGEVQYQGEQAGFIEEKGETDKGDEMERQKSKTMSQGMIDR